MKTHLFFSKLLTSRVPYICTLTYLCTTTTYPLAGGCWRRTCFSKNRSVTVGFRTPNSQNVLLLTYLLINCYYYYYYYSKWKVGQDFCREDVRTGGRRRTYRWTGLTVLCIRRWEYVKWTTPLTTGTDCLISLSYSNVGRRYRHYRDQEVLAQDWQRVSNQPPPSCYTPTNRPLHLRHRHRRRHHRIFIYVGGNAVIKPLACMGVARIFAAGLHSIFYLKSSWSDLFSHRPKIQVPPLN